MPLSLKDISVDLESKKAIDEHVFQLSVKDLVEAINNFIKLDDVHKEGYMSFEGNPYGKDSQRYQVPRSYSLFSTGYTATTKNQYGEIVSQYRQNEEYKRLNYPHPDNTIRALRDLVFAIKTDNDVEREKIRLCYPTEAQKYLFDLMVRYGMNMSYHKESLPRPHDLDESYMLEPSRIIKGDIEPIYFNPSLK